jgi:lipid A 4'-phosphatase
MHRTGLIVALFVAAGAGLVLGLFPEIDLWIARAFYDVIDANDDMFTLGLSPTISTLRKFGTWFEILLIASPVLALITKLFLPQTKMFISGRAVVFLILSYALGPGLLVNVALKDNWGRPRPVHITHFGGDKRFITFWDFRGECPRNCSFVSGEASSAAWTIAPAALAPISWRPLAYGAALTFYIIIALLRIAVGAHFLSDAIFAGVLTFLIIWLMYALIYRWRSTRLSDEAVENGLERFSSYCRSAMRRLICRPAEQVKDAKDSNVDSGASDGRHI